VYESADEKESRLLFFSDSVSFLGGGGDLEMLGDLVTDLGSIWPESLRGGDLDVLDRLSFRLAEFLEVSLGDSDLDKFVEIVDTEEDEADADRILLGAPRLSGSSLCLSRFRPLSCSAFASCSSATPFLQVHISQRYVVVSPKCKSTEMEELARRRIHTFEAVLVVHHSLTSARV
jgi:hypothetical protein